MKKLIAKIDVLQDPSFSVIAEKLYNTLEGYTDIYPDRKDAKILIKPNLNSNMNAMTGNTTDLRLLGAVISFFQKKGYTDICIGEGTNSGFYRSGISVISRLKVDELAAHYGVKCIDLNDSEVVTIPFEDGVEVGIAKDCVEADFLINMPKLKTHFEAGMSLCLKNLVGCLVGQENKKKTHLSLAENICNITAHVPPHLHIVDAIFSMEGLGPTKGTPVKTDMVVVGRDPFLIDLLAARFAQFDYRKVPSLVVAEKRGILDSKSHEYVDKFPISIARSPFAPPKAGPIATFIHNPARQKYFLAIRNTSFFNYLCNTKIVGKILFLTDLRQDVFIEEEMELDKITFSHKQCVSCGRCKEYCPIGLDLPKAIGEEDLTECISCLYCFCVCPEKAIGFEGKLGFMAEQLDQYDEIIRKIA